MKKVYSGINIQYPISQLILSGAKTVETRTYPIPEKYVGQDLLLIETPGTLGKFKARIVAVIRFERCFKYENSRAFYNDTKAHRVTLESPWAWDAKKGKWGWVIAKVEPLPYSRPVQQRIGIRFTTNLEF